MPQLPPKRALALALALLLGCSSPQPPATRAAASGFVIPTQLPNGRVEVTIASSYPLGRTMTVPISIEVTRGTATGPLNPRIVASGINGAHTSAEVLVRELSATPITVTAGGKRSTSVSWDTHDGKGALVPADAYSLVFEVRSDDGGVTRTITAGATLEVR